MRNTSITFFITFLCLIILTGCSSRPDRSERSDNVEQSLIEQHQRNIAAISNWTVRGRIAFFDLRENNRNAASLSWAKTNNLSFLRLSHPLRGTLAQLEQTPLSASLIDNKGEQYFAPTIDELLAWQLGLMLPFNLVEAAMTGKRPPQLGSGWNFYADGSLASYTVTIHDSALNNKQHWHVSLSHYQPVNSAFGSLKLPHQLEITHVDYKIRLQINEWSQVE